MNCHHCNKCLHGPVIEETDGLDAEGFFHRLQTIQCNNCRGRVELALKGGKMEPGKFAQNMGILFGSE